MNDGPILTISNALHQFKDLTDLKKKDLLYMMSNQEKVRFVTKENKIKATYGHTIEIKKNAPAIPPDILYHGTSHKYTESIKAHGLIKMQRQFVHLSIDIYTAMETGKRKDGNPVIVKVDSKRAYKEGLLFFRGSYIVWLSENIPSVYLNFTTNEKKEIKTNE